LPKNPFFRISAAVVKQLGEQLVSDELTAIMELVKNSYDADADWVRITIATSASPNEPNLTFGNTRNGYIIIEDNGNGMTYDDIVEKWLFISVSHKRDMKVNGLVTEKGRTPLGDKGLGRLSTQRLGDILEMFSGKKGEDLTHHVAFDWRDFSEEGSLESVNTNYKEIHKSSSKEGTKLIITELKNSSIWIGEAGDRFRGQLSKLIFPFKEERKFNIYLNINGQSFDLDEINDKLRDLAISKYKIDFDGNKLFVYGSLKFAKLQGNSTEKNDLFSELILKDNGIDFFNFLTQKESSAQYSVKDINYIGENNIFFSFNRVYDFETDILPDKVLDNTDRNIRSANPGPFQAEIDEFNLSGTDEVESAYDSLSEYKRLVKNQTGVRIFRDGFGIKPYGMENKDWLNLTSSQTSGKSFYLLRPENIIGFVSITAEANKTLVEKTDREGFMDTPYSRNFFKLLDRAIKDINLVIGNTRRSYDIFVKQNATIVGKIRSFNDVKERLVITGKQSKIIENEVSQVAIQLRDTKSKVTAEVKKTKLEPLFASPEQQKALGLLEEVEKLLETAQSIFDRVNNILNIAKNLENDANYLEPRLNELENQIVLFSELAGLGITAEAFTHEMYNILDRVGIQTDQVLRQIKKTSEINTIFFVYTEQVKSFIVSIRRQLNHLAPSLRFNRETKDEIQLSVFVKGVKEYYESRSKIKINIEINNDFSIRANSGKLTQIIDNIILNSEFWLNDITKTNTEFQPQLNIIVDSPFLKIFDNGYGIIPALENNLFQPFVTTKPQGRGLGLFIVQQLLDTLSGNIVLLNKRNVHNRRYIFQITFNLK
jgi:signal transduction histidine kinase